MVREKPGEMEWKHRHRRLAASEVYLVGEAMPLLHSHRVTLTAVVHISY